MLDPILFGLIYKRLAIGALVLHGHAHVLCFGGQPSQSESQCIGTELLDHIDRIDSVALGLRHRLAESIEDLRMDVDLAERDLANVVQTHENHPGDPEGDDISRGDQGIGRIEVIQIVGFIGPTER